MKTLKRVLVPVLIVAMFAVATGRGHRVYATESPLLTAMEHAEDSRLSDPGLFPAVAAAGTGLAKVAKWGTVAVAAGFAGRAGARMYDRFEDWAEWSDAPGYLPVDSIGNVGESLFDLR